MDKKLKRKWINALRSGAYKQGRDALIKDPYEDLDGDAEYCCLGVLCEVAGEQLKYEEGSGMWHHDDKDTNMPRRGFLKKHGLLKLYTDPGECDEPAYRFEYEIASYLAEEMNDCGDKSFDEIADWIEENV